MSKLVAEIVRLEDELFARSERVERWKGVADEHLEILAEYRSESDEVRSTFGGLYGC